MSWILALVPWAVSASVCVIGLRVPPSALRSKPFLRDDAPRPSPSAPEPPKPKGVRYEPWEKVPS
jgi:hypothetical protein